MTLKPIGFKGNYCQPFIPQQARTRSVWKEAKHEPGISNTSIINSYSLRITLEPNSFISWDRGLQLGLPSGQEQRADNELLAGGWAQMGDILQPEQPSPCPDSVQARQFRLFCYQRALHGDVCFAGEQEITKYKTESFLWSDCSSDNFLASPELNICPTLYTSSKAYCY